MTVVNGSSLKHRLAKMHVHTQYYKKITSDQVGYLVEPSEKERLNATAVIIEIPESVNITSLPGVAALTIPEFPNANYIKLVVDGNILGAGGYGSGGGVQNHAQNTKIRPWGDGLIRGGGASSGAVRNAFNGPVDLVNGNKSDLPRIFNF